MSALGHKQTLGHLSRHVRFTPESGHSSERSTCLLCANSGHCTTPALCEVATERHAGLLPVGFRDLADQLGPVHIERPIDRAGLGPTVVFEDFDHEGRVV
jgi:hypothetical protein